MRLFHSALAAACFAALAAGCALQPQTQESAEKAEPAPKPSAPLYEVKESITIACNSSDSTPLSTAVPFSKIKFECSQLNAVATYPEMLDAGWRLDSVYVVDYITVENIVTMPLKITIRKLN